MRRFRVVAFGLFSLALLLAACNSDPTSAEACGNIAATELSPGQTALVTGSSACVVASSATAQYALVAYNGAPTGGANSTVALEPSNITTISSILAAVQSLGAPQQLVLSARQNDAFHARLRALESRTLTSRMAAARQWLAARNAAPRFDRAPAAAAPGVGDMVSLNTNTDNACDSPQVRSGVVAAVGTRSIVIADPSNPAGGYTNADYQSIATQFDTLIDPLVTGTFGTPSDIDQNGKVILFFTGVVNQLTPAHSDFYIGGFFFARDLFPTTTSPTIQGCAGSNFGEMFYLMVPDPNGTLGNTFSKAFVSSTTPALLAHEYQHLVNASRRLYVNTTATDLEDTWVDEGLSHSAEELLFYRQTGLTPRSNLSATTIRGSSAYVQAFNSDVSGNFGSLIEFLKSPSDNSPYADNDSLATRGATWSFLRYAVDRHASSDGNTWFQLTNSVTTGRGTLTSVFGADIEGLFRDWGTSLVADDVTGSDANYQQKSWQYRSLIAAVQNDGTYPLDLTPLTSGVRSTTTLVPGGAVYYPFAVGATAATLTWTAGGETLFALTRLK